MAEFKAKGIDEYISALEKYSDHSEGIIKKAVYKGAGIVAKQVQENIKSLPEEEFRFGTPSNPLVGVTKEQKADLLEGFGISKFDTQAFKAGYPVTDVKLGFDGYGSTSTNVFSWDKTKGKIVKHGQMANVVLARAIESGTTFRKKNAFVRRAVNKARGEATDTMIKTVDDETKKIV